MINGKRPSGTNGIDKGVGRDSGARIFKQLVWISPEQECTSSHRTSPYELLELCMGDRYGHQGFFDNIDHGLMIRSIRHYIQ